VISGPQQLGNPRIRIGEIAKLECMGRTIVDTGRQLPLQHPMHTKGAFVHETIRMHISGIIGTGGHTGFAPRTLVSRNLNAASRPYIAGARGTGRHTERTAAVVTAFRAYLLRELGENPSRLKDQPVAIPLKG